MFISISNEHLTIFNELDHMTKMSVQQTLNGSQALHASVVVVRVKTLIVEDAMVSASMTRHGRPNSSEVGCFNQEVTQAKSKGVAALQGGIEDGREKLGFSGTAVVRG